MDASNEPSNDYNNLARPEWEPSSSRAMPLDVADW